MIAHNLRKIHISGNRETITVERLIYRSQSGILILTF